MEEQKKQDKQIEAKFEEKKVETKVETKPVEAKVEKKPEPKQEKPKEETKTDDKKDDKPKQEEKKEKEAPKKPESKLKVKEKAIANAYSLQISPKFTKAICKMIKRKDPDTAIKMLEKVVAGKLPVKMTNLEVPHQKGKGISGARFPKNVASEIIGVVSQLKANAVVNGIEEPIITIAMSNQASAPLRRGGRKAKRTNVHLEAMEKTKLLKSKK